MRWSRSASIIWPETICLRCASTKRGPIYGRRKQSSFRPWTLDPTRSSSTPRSSSTIQSCKWYVSLRSRFFLHLSRLLQVLNGFGIKVVELNGSVRATRRHAILSQFQSNVDINEPRVLLLSSIGSVGLNIDSASIVIMLVSFILSIQRLTIRLTFYTRPRHGAVSKRSKSLDVCIDLHRRSTSSRITCSCGTALRYFCRASPKRSTICTKRLCRLQRPSVSVVYSAYLHIHWILIHLFISRCGVRENPRRVERGRAHRHRICRHGGTSRQRRRGGPNVHRYHPR